MNVAGLTALVTGGSKGMGKEWARLLLKDGADVIIWGRNKIDLENAKEELLVEFPERHVEFNCVDVGDIDRLEKALKDLIDRYKVDILINNAGIVFRGFLNEIDPEKSTQIIKVNLMAPVIITQKIIQSMIERNFGYVVNVSSLAGFIGVPKMAVYSASKWGLVGFSEAIRQEMIEQGKNGVRIMTFCPSYVQTDLFQGATPPLLTRWLRPEDTVKRAYQGLKDGKHIIFDPDFGRLVAPLKGLLPEKFNDRLRRILGVNSSSGV